MDCFNCTYNDCMFDGITAAEIAASNERTRQYRAITDKVYAAQREYREATREKFENVENGHRLRIARKEKGLTQAQLSQLVGLKQRTISRFETGELQFDFSTFYGLLCADKGKPSPIHADEKDRTVRCDCFTPIPKKEEAK